MESLTISSKFHVVIPKNIRQRFHLQPGQKLIFIPNKNTLRVVFASDIKEGYGFLKGIDANIEREEEDRE